MCEIGEKEIRQCEKLAQALANKNGRCNYHEDLVKGIHSVGGMVKVLLALVALLVGISTFSAIQLDAHKGETAHPVMEQRYQEMKRQIDQYHPDWGGYETK